MPAPSTTDEFLAIVKKSDLFPPERLDEFVARRLAANTLPGEPLRMAQHLVHDGLLTKYQAEQLLGGRWRNFLIGGKYKLLEKLGHGGMAMVFLCEHQVMKRRVALKILPTNHAEDRELLGRFHREARALSQLRHPNIVGAYDVDNAGKIHFLVMEYIDGGDLDVIVQKSGPMAYGRAAHYIRQAAHGLQHAHECGLVHRDIKPGNLLVDRAGTVKLLDLGLARIFHETTDDLTTGRDSGMLLGTVDYLAPEQAINSHDVDIRADIYGLGATFYFLLTGKGLFEDGTVAQKLSWHLHRPPMPISQIRPDVPEELLRVIDKMLAKKPEDRYQTPEEVDEALVPWTRDPIPPPEPAELPQLSLAAKGTGPPSSFHRIVSPSVRTSISAEGRTSDSHPSRETRPLPVEPPPPEVRPSAAPAPVSPAVAIAPTPARRPWAARWRRPIPAAAMAGGLLVLVGGGWWAFRGPGGGETATRPVGPPPLPNSSGPGRDVPAGSNTPGAARSPSAEPSADARFLVATGSAPPQPHPSLHAAIRAARSKDRILVRGRLMIEAIDLSIVDGAPKDLTIEGEDPDARGGPVRWRGPRDLARGRALLDVYGMEGFRLKGFAFDGQGRIPDLVRLTGRAAGSTIEDVQVEGASRAGVVLRGWGGESSRPATIRGVRFSTDREVEAAILFESDGDHPSVASESIRVEDCRFVGPYQAALLVAGPVLGLEVQRCRIHRATDGLRYQKGPARDPFRARLANNVFADLQRGVHFETTPPAGSGTLEMLNNVFSNTPRLATLDKVSVQPSRSPARWIWTEEGKKTTIVPPGVRSFRKVFELTSSPEAATLDIGCDESFTAWINGVEVAKEPSPHFTQRVYSFPVADKLRRGRNVLAVRGTNRADRLDSRFGTTAGLLAQITARSGGRDQVVAPTDPSWKWAEKAPEGWNRAEFDDHAWTSARPWPETENTWPWLHAVWDSEVAAGLKPPLEPIRVAASGNVRDSKSWEGYPPLDAERLVIVEKALPRNPDDEATFLRLPRSNPLRNAGPGGSPIGVFQGD
jgi:serine/threonine protein kinase